MSKIALKMRNKMTEKASEQIMIVICCEAFLNFELLKWNGRVKNEVVIFFKW